MQLSVTTPQDDGHLMHERESLGGYLKTHRETKGISKRELGRRSGVDHTLISRIETGERKMDRSDSRDTIVRLAQHVGASPKRALELAGHLTHDEVAVWQDDRSLDWHIRNDPSLTDEQRRFILAAYRLAMSGGSPGDTSPSSASEA